MSKEERTSDLIAPIEKGESLDDTDEIIENELLNTSNPQDEPVSLTLTQDKIAPEEEVAVPLMPLSAPTQSPGTTLRETTISTTTTVVTKKEESITNKPIPTSLPTVIPSKREEVIKPVPVPVPVSVPVSSTVEPSTVLSVYSSYPYKSNISPRHTVISRRQATNTERNVSYQSSNFNSSLAIQTRPTVLQSGLRETREKEKRELGELNDRFAGYVERVRFLEAQNKKLQLELNSLKGKWGQETKQIEKMYQIELDEARSVLNDTSKTKDTIQVKLEKAEYEFESLKKKYYDLEKYLNVDKERIKSLQDQIAANESEIGLLRRRLNDLQDEEKRYKQETQRVRNEIERVSNELENEMKQRLMLENDKQSLEEELCFIKEVHAKEIEEIKHLAFQESGIDPSQFFKSELSTAIREIREEYESLNVSQRNEMEGWYRIKVKNSSLF
jgi:predicted  nucleic acid-binding Zn-ribbon protein